MWLPWHKLLTFTWGTFAGLADYRYFPEPDLQPVQISDNFIEELQVGCSQMLLSAHL